jgi:hypothetical protein
MWRPRPSVEEGRRYKHSEAQAHDKHNCCVEGEPRHAEKQDYDEPGSQKHTGDDNEQAGDRTGPERDEDRRGNAPENDRYPRMETPSPRRFPRTKPSRHR